MIVPCRVGSQMSSQVLWQPTRRDWLQVTLKAVIRCRDVGGLGPPISVAHLYF